MTPLEELVRVLDCRSDREERTEWIQVFGTAEDYELVADNHLDRLFGFVAPPECWAIGMTAPGWARSTELTADSTRERVQITCLVARTGEVAGRITWAENRSISSYCGLICSSSRSRPAAS